MPEVYIMDDSKTVEAYESKNASIRIRSFWWKWLQDFEAEIYNGSSS